MTTCIEKWTTSEFKVKRTSLPRSKKNFEPQFFFKHISLKNLVVVAEGTQSSWLFISSSGKGGSSTSAPSSARCVVSLGTTEIQQYIRELEVGAVTAWSLIARLAQRRSEGLSILRLSVRFRLPAVLCVTVICGSNGLRSGFCPWLAGSTPGHTSPMSPLEVDLRKA